MGLDKGVGALVRGNYVGVFMYVFLLLQLVPFIPNVLCVGVPCAGAREQNQLSTSVVANTSLKLVCVVTRCQYKVGEMSTYPHFVHTHTHMHTRTRGIKLNQKPSSTCAVLAVSCAMRRVLRVRLLCQLCLA